MIKKYYDMDCNLGMLDGKTIAIIGFGSQGHAHAMNLNESGCDVVVGLRPGSAHTEKAEAAGLKVMDIEEAAEAGDIVMMLVPDELAAQVYSASLMAIEVDTAAERAYLDRLAKAMGLSPAVVRNIEQIVGMQQA